MIVLDTHVWLWWVNLEHDRFPATRLSEIETAAAAGVSVISCFEIAWLQQHGRIQLPCPTTDWFEKALAGSGIVCLPLTPTITARAVELPEHHKDPHDRLIIATALECGARLMSFDTVFPRYAELQGALLN